MNTGPEHVLSLISRIRERSNRLLTDELEAHGLGQLAPAHGDLLVALFRNNGMSMKALSIAIDRDKSTLTALVGRLEELGYVQRERDSADGRMMKVSLSEKGKALITPFKAMGAAFFARFYDGFSAGEKLILAELLERVRQNLWGTTGDLVVDQTILMR